MGLFVAFIAAISVIPPNGELRYLVRGKAITARAACGSNEAQNNSGLPFDPLQGPVANTVIRQNANFRQPIRKKAAK